MMAAEPLDLPTTRTPVLDAACAYIAMGLPPVPLYGIVDGRCACGNTADDHRRSAGKHPIGNAWQTRVPRTLDEVRDVFGSHLGNIGIYLGGTDPPCVVLDFDGPPGLQIRDELAAAAMLPRTLTARSGSGGEHRVYRFASRHDPGSVSDRRVGVGWDVKRSGQFVAAPSRHASGGAYEWTDAVPIAELPDDLYERIRKLAAPPPASIGTSDMAARARAYVDKMPPAISGSGGHAATFAVARKLVQDFRLGAGDAWGILCEYNRRCEPPWSEKDLRHKLEDALRAHTSNPVEDRPRPAWASPPAASGSAPHATGGGGNGGGGVMPSAAPDWRGQLLWTESRTGKPRLVQHHENVVRILQLHPAWRGKIRYDEFRRRTVVVNPPWSAFARPHESEPTWDDEDATRLAGWLRTEFHAYAFAPSVLDCERAVDVVARVHGWHPVRDYLTGLAWDQVTRLAKMGPVYFAAAADDYTANVFRWWMISAVARTLSPGIKADHILILEGSQGIGKSTALSVLAGEWFSDTPIDLNSKDAYAQIRGKWIVELAELDSLFKATASRAKTFFSSPKDDYRPAYGRHQREQRRQCVFAGSVNEGVYLHDPTGARRYWPVRCGALDIEGLRRDRDQLWAEAVWWYREGARWWPVGKAENATLAEEQEARTAQDDWQEKIERYLAKGLVAVSSAELMEHALNIEPRDWTRAAQMRVGVIMVHGLRWAKRRPRDGSPSRRWVYERPEIGMQEPA